MTIDGAVRVTNAKNNIILALSRSGAAAALIHPNGRVYHYGSRVEIQARHQQGNNKLVTSKIFGLFSYFSHNERSRYIICPLAILQVFRVDSLVLLINI